VFVNFKLPCGDQCLNNLVDGLRNVLVVGESFSQPYIQRVPFCVGLAGAMLLTLNDVIPSSAPNMSLKLRDVETSPFPSVR